MHGEKKTLKFYRDNSKLDFLRYVCYILSYYPVLLSCLIILSYYPVLYPVLVLENGSVKGLEMNSCVMN